MSKDGKHESFRANVMGISIRVQTTKGLSPSSDILLLLGRLDSTEIC